MSENIEKVAYAARMASGLILANGGETYRAEETAVHIGAAFGYHMDIVALPTGLTMTLMKDGEATSTIVRVCNRTTDLLKLEQVNTVSRGLASHEMELDEAIRTLRAINKNKGVGVIKSLIYAGGTGAMFALMFCGSLFDVLAAGCISALIQIVLLFLPDQEGMPLSCLAGGFLAAALTLLAVNLAGQGGVDRIIWSIMMPLLPGLSFTNAIRDSMRGDMVSGSARLTDAVMHAIVLASGAGLAMMIYLRMGGVLT